MVGAAMRGTGMRVKVRSKVDLLKDAVKKRRRLRCGLCGDVFNTGEGDGLLTIQGYAVCRLCLEENGPSCIITRSKEVDTAYIIDRSKGRVLPVRYHNPEPHPIYF